MERGLLLDVVVLEGAALLQLLAGEDEALLVRRDALLVLDLGLHVVNCVRWFCKFKTNAERASHDTSKANIALHGAAWSLTTTEDKTKNRE